jgi:pimeloyl-ACP methyl ester carboxylesterase
MLLAVGLGVLLLFAAVASQLPAIGAGALLHPARQRRVAAVPATCDDVTLTGAGVNLAGWRCRASTRRRGTLVYLHGIADTRASASGIIERFGRRGFDVVAYDSRAHGESEGEICTYGFFEKDDLRLVLDTVADGPIVLLGMSLGAAVALQHAARDRRVTAVIAAEPFSDLRTIAIARAPLFFTSGAIERAFTLAEQQGNFRIGAVDTAAAARSIAAPVLLIHGAVDSDTSPEHAQRVLAALPGPKRLILVPDAGHNQSLRGDVWAEIERWLDEVLISAAR